MSLFSMNLRREQIIHMSHSDVKLWNSAIRHWTEAVAAAGFSGISQFFSRADFFFCVVFFVLDVFLLNGPCINCKELKH